ncbi:MAG: hypothetical protein EOP52_13430 [Sphingobacteriales bacterium]|nr:MAG: hypothetical protein EOP52_13430 [Sphingobacteriales bacterium]
MLIFLLYTLFFWIGTAGLVKVLHQSIQKGEWLDKLLGWQAMLDRLYGLGGWRKDLTKPLGECAFCFSHLVTFLCFWFYVLFAHTVLRFWISWPAEHLITKIFLNIGWYGLYGSVGTVLSTMVLMDFKKLKKDADK